MCRYLIKNSKAKSLTGRTALILTGNRTQVTLPGIITLSQQVPRRNYQYSLNEQIPDCLK